MIAPPTAAAAAARPAHYLRAVSRGAAIAGIVGSAGASAAIARLKLPAARRHHARAGERAARRLDRLGGAYLKAGQLLSTRPDLLSDAQRAPLRRLCDRATPAGDGRGLAALLAGDGVVDVVERPFAAGSVTDVHLARRADTGERVAVKILRPDARARFTADLTLVKGCTRLASRLPIFRLIPTIAAVDMLAEAVAGHLDLHTEAAHQARLAEAFAARDGVMVPRPHLDLCTPSALVMDYVQDALRIDDPRLHPRLQATAAVAALRALYDMLFNCGLVHCDLHPGNMLVTSDGVLVLIDFGYACELDEDQQIEFARLFRAMALGDPDAIAGVIVRTAVVLPERLDEDALVADLEPLMSDITRSSAERFNAARFTTALFLISRRHRILASPTFSMAVVSLITIEGVLKELTPGLDFQREALPSVLGCLARAGVA
ncbi:MAG TPA: AarF/UbiB family protein [Solirubrobacteraceae bacterium]